MKALIAMSGGVDSSVAAYIMKTEGFECIGCTMKLWEPVEDSNNQELQDSRTCCSLDDTEDARSVASRLGMPFYVFNYKNEFRDKVMKSFAQSYLLGLTPNPCIECNRCLKFGSLLRRAQELGCDVLVTGHYARIEQRNGIYHLFTGKDPGKDQSYVLWNLTQEQLSRLRFPLGGLTKDHVREIAARHGFINASKPDSQDICFVPDGDYAKAVESISGKTSPPGDFVSSGGSFLGKHKGIIHYTVGQRKGLGIAFGTPLYVLSVDPSENQVVLGSNEELFKTDVSVRDVNWIAGKAPDSPLLCKAKLRYRQKPAEAFLYPFTDENGQADARLEFKEPQRAVTPGQSAVFYIEDEVLGGGIIL